MKKIRNVALAGLLVMIGSFPTYAFTGTSSWLEDLQESTRAQLAVKCLYGFREASRDSAEKELWKKRFIILRGQNENEPLTAEEYNHLQSLVDSSLQSDGSKYRALYAVL